MEPRDEIFEAVQAGRAARVEALLDAHPDLIDAHNAQGDSLLLAAAYAGRRPIFEALLRRGAPVGLFEASALGLDDRVQQEIDRQPAAIGSYSHDGWTPLHLASFFGHLATARLLLDRGADVDARSRSERFAQSNTPLHAAAANKQTGVAGLLIERGADVNARDGSGYTPLALAANNKNDVLVILLLEKGARV